MKTAADVLDETLGVLDPVEQELKGAKTKVVVKRPSDGLEDVDADYKYQRENFYNLVERGQDAIEGILDLAKESEHPRTYEVAGQLIKTVSETSEKLLQIQKMMDDLEDERPKHQTTNQNLFVGSTAELQKLLKKSNAETKE